MPTYDYQCGGCGVVSSRIERMVDKAESVPCEGCGGVAAAVFTPPMLSGRPQRYGTGERWHGRGTPVEDAAVWRWYACEAGHESLERSVDAMSAIRCQEEGCELEAALQSGVPGFGNRFWVEVEREGGYYDQGLGEHVYSRQHRDAICAARGIAPVDGGWDLTMAAARRRMEDADAESDREYGAYYDEVYSSSDPVYVQLREEMGCGERQHLLPPRRS